MASHCHQDISFPRGWFNTYPQTQPNTTQHNNVPGNSRKVRKREPPPADPLQQVILGLLSLAISIGRDNRSKNPKASKQACKNHTNQQQGFNSGRGRGANIGGNKEGNRAGKGRGNSNKGSNNGNNGGQSRQSSNNSNRNNTTESAKGTTPKFKCTICNGDHGNLMYCSKLTQYLPYGTNQQPPPVSLCLACLSTKHWNAKNCDHMSNIFYKSQLCPITNKHYLMCKGCAHHLPAIKYMSDHHEPSLGYKNFTLMKQCLVMMCSEQ